MHRLYGPRVRRKHWHAAWKKKDGALHTPHYSMPRPLRARTLNSGLCWATPMSLKDGLLRAGAALGSNLVSLTSRPIDHLYSRLSGFNGPFFPQACSAAWVHQHARCMAPQLPAWAHVHFGLRG